MKAAEKKGSQIRYGSIVSYTLIFVNIALGIVYTPWILKRIGSSHYGLYTLAVSLINIFLIDFGMKDAVTRFIAKYRAEGKKEKIDEFVGMAVKFYCVITGILAAVLLVVFFFLPKLYVTLTAEELKLFQSVYAITASLVVICFPVNICNGILNAYEQYVGLKLSDIFNKIGTVVITIIALILHGDVLELVLINGLMNFVTLLAKLYLIKKYTDITVEFKRNNPGQLKEVFSFSAWTSVSSIAQQMFFNMIPSILAMVTDTFAITLYGFANTIEGYVWNITEAINGLFIPTISREITGQKDAKNVLPLMVKVGRLNLSVTTLLLIGLTVLGREFVHLWLGDDFLDLYYCILLLAWPYYISSAQQIANNSLIVLNKVKYTALIHISFGCFNLIASYFAGGYFGVTGICAVTCFAFLMRTLATNVVYIRVLKIDILSFFKECHLRMAAAQLFCIIVLVFINFHVTPCSDGLFGWPLFLLKAISVGAFYFIVMWFAGWNSYEKLLIKSMLGVGR